MEKLVTFESVSTACESLAAAGKKTSVREVIAQLGGGSPNDVLPLLRQWKNGRSLVMSKDIQIDPRISQIVCEQIQSALKVAAKATETARTETEEDLDAISKQCQLAETVRDQLAAELEQTRQLVRSLQDQVEQLKTRNEQITEEISVERAAAERARIAQATAELRLEDLQGLKQDLANAQSVLAQTKTIAAESHELAAVANAKHCAAERANAELKALLDEAKQAVANSTKRAEIAERLLAEERGAVQAGNARLEGAAREINAANDATSRAVTEAKLALEQTAELRGQLAQMRQVIQV